MIKYSKCTYKWNYFNSANIFVVKIKFNCVRNVKEYKSFGAMVVAQLVPSEDLNPGFETNHLAEFIHTVSCIDKSK